MPILNNDKQQKIFRRVWSNDAKRIYNDKMGPGMDVIGCVAGNVSLTDIGKIVPYNQVVTLNELEINQSRDLHQAIKRGWIRVIKDRGALKRALVMPQSPPQGVDRDELMVLAKEMAKEMSKEMLKQMAGKNSELMNEVKDLKETIKQQPQTTIVNNNVAPEQQAPKQDKFLIEEENPDNVIIDVDENVVQPKMKEIGKVKEEKTDLSGSLAKMKKFRRKQNG